MKDAEWSSPLKRKHLCVWWGDVPLYIYIYIYIDIDIYIYNHHLHVVPLARIFLTLSRHFSVRFIASGRSSGLHPVSSHSCCMYVRAGLPAFARSYVGVHKSKSLMSSSLLPQLCPACLVRLTWIVFVMGIRWPYSWCFVWCCRQDLFNIARKWKSQFKYWLMQFAFLIRLIPFGKVWI